MHAPLYDAEMRLLRGVHGDVRVTPDQHVILAAMLRRRGRYARIDSLIREIWPGVPGKDEPDFAYQSLRVQIFRLRRGMERFAVPARIETRLGVGYAWIETAVDAERA